MRPARQCSHDSADIGGAVRPQAGERGLGQGALGRVGDDANGCHRQPVRRRKFRDHMRFHVDRDGAAALMQGALSGCIRHGIRDPGDRAVQCVRQRGAQLVRPAWIGRHAAVAGDDLGGDDAGTGLQRR